LYILEYISGRFFPSGFSTIFVGNRRTFIQLTKLTVS